jgi:hypothetical protein
MVLVMLLAVAAIALLCAGVVGRDDALAGAREPWRRLEAGLELAEFLSPVAATSGDSRIRVLRVDPERFQLRLLNASAPGEGESRSARDWCATHSLLAAVNASMYQEDLVTSVSLMRSRDHVNNPRLTRDMAVLAFDRRDESVPRVQIIDRECQDYERVSAHYRSLVQSIRLVSCRGKNVWRRRAGSWSTAAIATDRDGRLLMLHTDSAFQTQDFVEALVTLPLDVTRAMYAEGGPEAQLYIHAGGEEFEFVSFGSGRDAWPVPNVVGVARR